jgi:hypothetical protein
MFLLPAVVFHRNIVVSLADLFGIPMLHLNRDFYFKVIAELFFKTEMRLLNGIHKVKECIALGNSTEDQSQQLAWFKKKL